MGDSWDHIERAIDALGSFGELDEAAISKFRAVDVAALSFAAQVATANALIAIAQRLEPKDRPYG